MNPIQLLQILGTTLRQYGFIVRQMQFHPRKGGMIAFSKYPQEDLSIFTLDGKGDDFEEAMIDFKTVIKELYYEL